MGLGVLKMDIQIFSLAEFGGSILKFGIYVQFVGLQTREIRNILMF
jgi:hypothetical protein